MSKFMILKSIDGTGVIINVEYIVEITPASQGSYIRMLNAKRRLHVEKDFNKIVSMIRREDGYDRTGNA